MYRYAYLFYNNYRNNLYYNKIYTSLTKIVKFPQHKTICPYNIQRNNNSLEFPSRNKQMDTFCKYDTIFCSTDKLKKTANK